MEELYKDKDWQILVDTAPLPDGREKRVPRVKRADSAHVLAFNDDGTILLIREYRPYYHAHIWMLPSGRIDKEGDIQEGAQRELREETGFRAHSLEYLWSANHSESIIMTNHFFLARDLSPDPLPQDEDETIEVHAMSVNEALQKIHESEKTHLASAYGLLRFVSELHK